jgi:hypothetical protein
MQYLPRHKIDLAYKMGSRASRADVMESITCGWLSLVAVVSLSAQALFGFLWIDSVGSLAIVWLLIKEGRALAAYLRMRELNYLEKSEATTPVLIGSIATLRSLSAVRTRSANDLASIFCMTRPR